MKALITLLLTAVFCGFITHASGHEADIANDHNGPLTAELFVGIANKHVQPNGVRMYDHVLGTAGLHLWHRPSGIYFEALARGGFDQAHTHGKENEFDFGFGINREIGKFRYDFSGTYDHSIHMGSKTLDDFIRLGFIFGWDTKEVRRNLSISPYVGIQTYIALGEKSKHFEDGTIWTLAGIDFKSKITDRLSLVYTPSLAWDDGFMKARPGLVLTNAVNITYQLTKHAHLKLGGIGIISRQPVGIMNFSIGFEFP